MIEMTPAPPTEDQLLIVRRIADDAGLRRGNAIYALLADYARLKEDAARLDGLQKDVIESGPLLLWSGETFPMGPHRGLMFGTDSRTLRQALEQSGIVLRAKEGA